MTLNDKLSAALKSGSCLGCVFQGRLCICIIVFKLHFPSAYFSDSHLFSPLVYLKHNVVNAS